MTPFGRQPVTAGLLAAHALSENASPCPDADKWQVLRNLTVAREEYGISDRDLAVLSALISFHPKQTLEDRDALVVFPSNASLCERAHGMAESTLRRHIAALVKSGLIIRRDSPNGKRFARRSQDGARIAYGFDLRPLLALAQDIQSAAENARAAALRLRKMREEIVIRLRDVRKMLEWTETNGGDCAAALEICLEIQGSLRRKPNLALLSEIEHRLDALNVQFKNEKPSEMSGDDSQNERHYQNNNTDFKDFERSKEDELTLNDVLQAAPEIQNYCQDDIIEWHDLIRTAWFVFPMLGITVETWEKARAALGDPQASAVLACMLQRAGSIENPGAYLRRLTQQALSERFSPEPMVAALLKSAKGDQLTPQIRRC